MVITSDRKITLPEEDVVTFVTKDFPKRRNQVALVDGYSSSQSGLTYIQLMALEKRVATGFQRLGLGKQECVCIFSPNVPEYPAVLFGVMRIGGVCCRASPLFDSEHLEMQLRASSSRFLVTAPPFAMTALAAAKKVGIPPKFVFVFGEADGCTPFKELIGETSTSLKEVNVKPDDTACICFSSGSGKLIRFSHRNMVASILQSEDGMDGEGYKDHSREIYLSFSANVAEGETLLGAVPFSHAYGLTLVLLGLWRGGRVVVLDKLEWEQKSSLLTCLKTFSIAWMHITSSMIAFLKKKRTGKIHVGKGVVFGGEAVSEDVKRDAKEMFSCKVMESYGLTEAFPIFHASLNEETGSCGKLVANTACKIVDMFTGEEVARNQLGELWVCGPQCNLGDVFLPTGDVAVVDSKGFGFVRARSKEVILYEHRILIPKEVKAAIMKADPHVQSVMIEREEGDSLRVVITTTRDASITPKRVRDILGVDDVEVIVEEKNLY